MNKLEKQIERVKKFEIIFNKALDAVKNYDNDKETFNNLKDDIDELFKYYESKQWREDYDTDEKGLFPKDLNRGVLSEDGIWNLMDDIKELEF